MKKYHPLYGRATVMLDLALMFRVFREYVRALFFFRQPKPIVTVYGSARVKEDNPYYHLGVRLGVALARENWTLLTGGGPGMMEAVSRGVSQERGEALGLNILLPHEQRPNRYLSRVFTFEFFFLRKLFLMRSSFAYVITPGGIGTLDEVMELVTLMQTKKSPPRAIIFWGNDFWLQLKDFIHGKLHSKNMVNLAELDFIHWCDDLEEVMGILRKELSGEK